MASPLEILKKYWNYAEFRALQLEIIDSVLGGTDTLALLPTGGGKSVCFQVPGIILDGVTIVITPLIALMKDQVTQLKERGILAAAIYSGMHKSDIDRILDNFVLGDYKFLYVSPERLLTELMIERTKRMKVSLLVVDEAHCISKWGHDFRPSYLKINEFRSHCKKASMIALTATATSFTQKDILEQLHFKKSKTFKKSFKRDCLAIKVFQSVSKNPALAELLRKTDGSCIVYAKTRKETQEISQFLNRSGISADYYHAGLTNELRFKKQDAWIQNKTRVMVSTNAFGMGIDKADVRAVYHTHVPESMEAYYQEIGRAGRDGNSSAAYLIYNQLDIERLRTNMEQAYPSYEALAKVYQSLCNSYKLAIGSVPEEVFEFDAYYFNSTFGLKSIPTFFAIKMLENQEIIALNDAYQSPSKFQFTVSNEELFDLQSKNEALENFTKTLLRIYGGELFTNTLMISESEIGKVLKLSRLQVEKLLRRLEQRNIGSYFQQSGKPTINFLGSRYDADKLPLDRQGIRVKKKRDEEAVHAMINYVSTVKSCRMAQLQDYFGEENPDNCGLCDYCIHKAVQDLKVKAIVKFGKKLEDSLPIMISEINFQETTSQNMEEVIHYFVDTKRWVLKEGFIELAK
ncbi:MAG: ATP-dependent DNA helicase RecQ [Psychromonas sp.]|jgi:ATP-dependent DNA helicase RecQ